VLKTPAVYHSFPDTILYAKFFIMKNCICLLLLAAFFSVSCHKENTSAVNADANKLSIANSTVTSSGKIIFSDENNTGGVAKIYLRKDGVYVLGLEQMNYKTTAPKNVYLSSTPHLTATSVKLFSSDNFCNNIYYPLSSGINVAALKYLIIQDDADTDPAAGATLT